MQDDVAYLLDTFDRVSDHIVRGDIKAAKREVDRVVEEFEEGPVAQWTEHHASNVGVAGSSPAVFAKDLPA